MVGLCPTHVRSLVAAASLCAGLGDLVAREGGVSSAADGDVVQQRRPQIRAHRYMINHAANAQDREIEQRPYRADGGVSCYGPHDSKLTIVTVVAKLPNGYVQKLRENRAALSDFGYEYCEYNQTLDPSRDAAWSKIRAVQDMLNRGRQTVVCMDADAYFVHKKRFEDIVDSYFEQGKEIVFTDDWNSDGGPLNTGVFVTRNTPWTKSFWKSIYDDFPSAINHTNLWEQRAVVLFKESRPEEFSDHAVIVPHNVMNGLGNFTGSFIAHPAGGHNFEDKYRLIEPRLDFWVNKDLPELDGDGDVVSKTTEDDDNES